MDPDALYIANLNDYGQVPQQSILSSTLRSGKPAKMVLFRFAAGQELSSHTSAVPAMLLFLSGEATVTLGGETLPANGGAFVYLPPKLEHAVRAVTETVMLLVLFV